MVIMFTGTCPSLYIRFCHFSLNHQARVEVEKKGLRSKEPKQGAWYAKTIIITVVNATFAEKESWKHI